MKDSRRLRPPGIIKPLGCYQARTRHVSTWYIYTFFSTEVAGPHRLASIWRKSVYHVCLISLRQFVKSKGAKEREKGGRAKNSHGSKSHRTVGRVRFAALPGSHKAHSWRTHLDRENRSWLTFFFFFLAFPFIWPKLQSQCFVWDSDSLPWLSWSTYLNIE